MSLPSAESGRRDRSILIEVRHGREAAGEATKRSKRWGREGGRRPTAIRYATTAQAKGSGYGAAEAR